MCQLPIYNEIKRIEYWKNKKIDNIEKQYAILENINGIINTSTNRIKKFWSVFKC